jgi:hypothetical protein
MRAKLYDRTGDLLGEAEFPDTRVFPKFVRLRGYQFLWNHSAARYEELPPAVEVELCEPERVEKQ